MRDTTQANPDELPEEVQQAQAKTAVRFKQMTSPPKGAFRVKAVTPENEESNIQDENKEIDEIDVNIEENKDDAV